MRSNRLHKFDAVTKRVSDVAPVVAFKRLVPDRGEAGSFHSGDQRGYVSDRERGVGLFCRSEVLLDSEMHFERPAFKPTSTPLSQMRRLRHLWYSKDALVDTSRCILAIGRHR